MTRAHRIPGLILAGGQSRRMGNDKTRLYLGDKPLIHHVIDRLKPQASPLMIAGPADLTAFTGLTAIGDARPGFAGPLAGILAGLRHVSTIQPQATHILTAPADTPFLPHDLVEKLAEKAGPRPAIARSGSRLHPVCALWPVALAASLDLWLDGERHPRLMDFVGETGCEIVDFSFGSGTGSDLDPFLNVNTPEEFEAAKSFLLSQEN